MTEVNKIKENQKDLCSNSLELFTSDELLEEVERRRQLGYGKGSISIKVGTREAGKSRIELLGEKKIFCINIGVQYYNTKIISKECRKCKHE